MTLASFLPCLHKFAICQNSLVRTCICLAGITFEMLPSVVVVEDVVVNVVDDVVEDSSSSSLFLSGSSSSSSDSDAEVSTSSSSYSDGEGPGSINAL